MTHYKRSNVLFLPLFYMTERYLGSKKTPNPEFFDHDPVWGLSRLLKNQLGFIKLQNDYRYTFLCAVIISYVVAIIVMFSYTCTDFKKSCKWCFTKNCVGFKRYCLNRRKQMNQRHFYGFWSTFFIVPGAIGDRVGYVLRNANRIDTPKTRLVPSYNSFIPKTVREWNSLIVQNNDIGTVGHKGVVLICHDMLPSSAFVH